MDARQRVPWTIVALLASTLVPLSLLLARNVSAGSDAKPDAALRLALERALDDERHAIAFYEAILDRFGERRPFSNIVHAERRHADALIRQFGRLGLAIPADRHSSKDATFNVPATFAEACDAAEIAEVRNVAMYDQLLESISDDAVREVFLQLRRASQERHLPAFRRHSNGWTVIEDSTLGDSQKSQQDRAADARTDMFERLMATLREELETKGPRGAIDVCRTVAPKIAAQVSEDRGVRIGRTSWALRNPANAAPPWTDLVLHDRPAQPRFASARDGRLGATFPIRLTASCVTCHGPREMLDAAVRETIEAAYPGDQAVGFGDGDLRGWFWIEVP